jgi:hypothetical protein
MPQHCSHRYSDGSACRRWASKASRFCYKHNPEYLMAKKQSNELPPEIRLACVEDLIGVVRQTLTAVRLGYMTPGQAYAVGYMVELRLKLEHESDADQGKKALRRNMVRTMLHDEDDPDTAGRADAPGPTAVKDPSAA